MAEMPAPWDTWQEHAYGVIVPYDFALDREIWRWAPDDVSLLLTRTDFHPMSSSVEMAELISTDESLHSSTAKLLAAEPEVVVYLCASGSFVRGKVGEESMREQMLAAGAPRAITTSSALLEALDHLGIDKVAVATPYVPSLAARLHMFLREAGVQVLSGRELGLGERIWRVTGPTVHDLAMAADHRDADALFISCTNLATYNVIAPLERALGKPVITANQVSMWAALRATGAPIVPNGQRLFDSGMLAPQHPLAAAV
ncbi:MAG: maleate cis-trans isomerase family protein [Nocardioidaceae bacterium]